MRGLERQAARALKRLDHLAGRLMTSTRRVLVDARTPMNLAVMRPVWRRLRTDPRVTLAFTTEQETSGVAEALAADGLRHALVPRAAAAWLRIDLAMTADAWNDAPLFRCRRRLNFFHGVAGKYDLDHPERLADAGLDRFDRLAFINADRLERYVAAGIPRERAALVGFPKLDDLLNGAWPAHDVRAALGLEPARPTVLYAPTFSTASSLQKDGERIIEGLLDQGRNVIVKLHDRAMVPHPKYTHGVDWPARLTRAFGSHPCFALARHPDSGPSLSAADVLVTDHSTVGFEFALLDRPIVVFDVPALKQEARVDDGRWALLRSMADVVASPDALTRAVDAALADPSPHREARRQAHALFAYAGTATERAVALAYELLDMTPLPAPDRSGTPSLNFEF